MQLLQHAPENMMLVHDYDAMLVSKYMLAEKLAWKPDYSFLASFCVNSHVLTQWNYKIIEAL